MCCAGSRLLVQEGIAERLVAKLRARMEKLRVGSPLDKAVDIGAIVAPVQLERIQRAGGAGRRRRRDDVAAVVGLPDRGLLLSADAVHRRAAVVDDRAGRDLRPGARDDDVPHAGRSRSRSRTTRRTASPRACGRRTSTSRSTSRRRSRRAWCGSTRPICSTPRRALAAIARAGSGAKAGARGCGSIVKRGRGDRACEGVAARAQSSRARTRRQRARSRRCPPIDRTPKLFIGGKQARPDSRLHARIDSPTGELVGEVGRRKSQGHPQRRRGGARGAASWARATGHKRAQILYYIAENLAGARGGVRRAHRRR